MTTSILNVRNLTTRLQVGSKIHTVVDDLSFDLYLGKTLALVGESGCGKSMAALSLMRILPHPPALPSKGEILYRGKNLLSLSEAKMRSIRGGKIAMIFQDPSTALNPVYTVGNQLIEAIELHRHLYGSDAEAAAVQALDEVGISSPKERLDDYPHQMSGGMKQRVMIAMALVGEPDILIADEPTTALDVTIQIQVLELIRKLQNQKGMALLLITHDMGIVAEMADEVIVMYASQGVEHGTALDIFDNKKHPYTIGLFDSRIAGSPSESHLKPIKGSVPSLGHYPQGCHFHPRCPFTMPQCRESKIPNFAVSPPHFHTARCLLCDPSSPPKQKVDSL